MVDIIKIQAEQASLFKNENRQFRKALFSSLVHLKPKYCLEIGTHIGQSTEVFQKYFDEYQPDGIVVTVDIHKYKDVESKNVKQLIVHPHVNNSSDWHYVNNEELLDHNVDSVVKNTELIRESIRNLSENQFDFCFLDGDHQRESVMKDFAISRNLLTEPQYILFDDTEDDGGGHDSVKIYEEIVAEEKYNVYDFSKEWDVYCGCALMWNKKTPTVR
jgi:predicted O-methyltransferase YrrM|tara:strand:+ start:156 stop:806 length:651 start_codon:yes stop_codon:yes gene_type:complete